MFNNFGLVLSMNFIFYTSVAKELKLKVKHFWGVIAAFVEVTGEKIAPGGGLSYKRILPSWTGLKQVKVTFTKRNLVILFIICQVGMWSQDLNIVFILKDCLFGAATLTKNADLDKCSYFGYGNGFDSRSLFTILSCYEKME